MIDDPIAQAAIEALLVGRHPVLAALRAQADKAIVTVERTGVGLFAHFQVPEALRLPDPRDYQLDDVHLFLRARSYPTHCVLSIRSGMLSELECYDVASEDWPQTPAVERVGYTKRRYTADNTWLAEPTESRSLDDMGLQS